MRKKSACPANILSPVYLSTCACPVGKASDRYAEKSQRVLLIYFVSCLFVLPVPSVWEKEIVRYAEESQRVLLIYFAFCLLVHLCLQCGKNKLFMKRIRSKLVLLICLVSLFSFCQHCGKINCPSSQWKVNLSFQHILSLVYLCTCASTVGKEIDHPANKK